MRLQAQKSKDYKSLSGSNQFLLILFNIKGVAILFQPFKMFQNNPILLRRRKFVQNQCSSWKKSSKGSKFVSFSTKIELKTKIWWLVCTSWLIWNTQEWKISLESQNKVWTEKTATGLKQTVQNQIGLFCQLFWWFCLLLD